MDGGGSLRCALLGDNIAKMAVDNGWSGIVINGCIRDSEDIARMDLGVKVRAGKGFCLDRGGPGGAEVLLVLEVRRGRAALLAWRCSGFRWGCRAEVLQGGRWGRFVSERS